MIKSRFNKKSGKSGSSSKRENNDESFVFASLSRIAGRFFIIIAASILLMFTGRILRDGANEDALTETAERISLLKNNTSGWGYPSANLYKYRSRKSRTAPDGSQVDYRREEDSDSEDQEQPVDDATEAQAGDAEAVTDTGEVTIDKESDLTEGTEEVQTVETEQPPLIAVESIDTSEIEIIDSGVISEDTEEVTDDVTVAVKDSSGSSKTVIISRISERDSSDFNQGKTKIAALGEEQGYRGYMRDISTHGFTEDELAVLNNDHSQISKFQAEPVKNGPMNYMDYMHGLAGDS